MASERYQCRLSPDLLEKAVTELNEPRNNEERLKAIDDLRESFDSETYGSLARTDDVFILRFLRAKKFNQKKALLALHNYHKVRKENKEIFDKVTNPALLKHVFEAGVIIAIDGAGKDGSCVIMDRLGKIVKGMDIYDLTAYGVLTVEKLLENERNQILGMQAVEDMENFNISIVTKVSPVALSKMNSIWQDAMPIRIKNMHVLNEGKMMDIIMAIFKLFIKQKLIDRIKCHGQNYVGVHEYVNPTMIPPCFGGTGPSFDSLVKTWNEQLEEDLPQDTKL